MADTDDDAALWCCLFLASYKVHDNFSEGLAGSLAEGSYFVSVLCCALEDLWRGAGELDVSLDADFEPLSRVSLLSEVPGLQTADHREVV